MTRIPDEDDALAQRAVERIRVAQQKGRMNVKLRQDELAALERRKVRLREEEARANEGRRREGRFS